MQLGRPERIRGIQNLAERRQFQTASDERGGPGAKVIHTQSDVQMDVIEGLGEISGLPLKGIAMQQHDGGIPGFAQEIQ